MWYHLTTVRTAIINKSINNKCWRRCGEREPFCTVGGNAEWCSHCGKQYRDTSKKDCFWPSNLTSGNVSEGTQNTNLKYINTPLLIAVLITIAKIWKQPKCPSIDEWIKQLWDINTMEVYSAVEKKKVLSFATF